MGAGCVAGEFPEFDSGAVLYVRSGAIVGDGSRASPFGTFGEALAALDADVGQVALAAGDYAIGVARLDRALTVAGVCASRTHLQGSLEVDGASMTLRGLRIGGGNGPAILAVEDATVDLDSVEIADATSAGVRMIRSTLIAADLWVHDTQPEPFTHAGGQGLLLQHAPSLLERVVIDGNAAAGIETSGMSSVIRVTDVVVRRTQGSGGLLSGFGLYAQHQGTFAGRRVVVEDNVGAAVRADTGGGVRLLNSVLRSPREQFAAVLAIESGASVTLEQSQVGALGGTAVLCDDSTLHLTDVLVEGAPSDPTGLTGAMLLSGSETAGTLSRVVLDRRGAPGMFIEGRAEVVASDLQIADSLRLGTEALRIRDGAEAAFSQLHVVRGLHGLATDSVMDDRFPTRVSVTNAWFEAPLGAGILSLDGAEFEGRGVVIQGSGGVAVASRTGNMQLTDFAIRDVLPDSVGCARALDLSEGTVTLRRGSISGASEAGVVLTAADGSVRDVDIRLDQRPCAAECDGPDAATRGVGLARYGPAVEGGGLVVTDTRVSVAGACGLQLDPAVGDAWLRTEVTDTGAALCLVGPAGELPEGIHVGDGVDARVREAVVALPGCTPSAIVMAVPTAAR